MKYYVAVYNGLRVYERVRTFLGVEDMPHAMQTAVIMLHAIDARSYSGGCEIHTSKEIGELRVYSVSAHADLQAAFIKELEDGA